MWNVKRHLVPLLLIALLFSISVSVISACGQASGTNVTIKGAGE